MKLTKILLIPLLLVAMLASTTSAVDGGPKTGGDMSTNPNGRPPRTQSGEVDGGPMSGTSTSTNPNGRTPITADTTTPTTTAPALPPMSGGDMSTNPNRPRTPTPTTTAPTPPPTATTTHAPSPKPTLTESSDHTELDTPSPSQNGGEAFDFSVIGDDGSNGNGLIGDVEPAPDAEGSGLFGVVTSNSTAWDFDYGETANEAEEPEALAATPSPVSNVSNAQAESSGHRHVASVVTVLASSILMAMLSC